MKIHDLRPPAGAKKKPKRVGRGPGSGMGKTSTRGQKGAKSRSGYTTPFGFEGGRMPLYRKLPKRGFFNVFRVRVFSVNVGSLARIAVDGEISPEILEKAGLSGRRDEFVKILGDGDLETALVVRTHRITKQAQEKIEKAGGKVVILEKRESGTGK